MLPSVSLCTLNFAHTDRHTYQTNIRHRPTHFWPKCSRDEEVSRKSHQCPGMPHLQHGTSSHVRLILENAGEIGLLQAVENCRHATWQLLH